MSTRSTLLAALAGIATLDAAMAADLQPEIDVPLLDGVSLAEAHAGLKAPRARSGSVSGTCRREVSSVSPELASLFAQRR